MGWEERNGHSFYYHKERQDDRVVSNYFGKGEFACCLALQYAVLRQDREALNRIRRSERERTIQNAREASALLDDFDAQIKDLLAASLVSRGFHTHKRQWRKRRCRGTDND